MQISHGAGNLFLESTLGKRRWRAMMRLRLISSLNIGRFLCVSFEYVANRFNGVVNYIRALSSSLHSAEQHSKSALWNTAMANCGCRLARCKLGAAEWINPSANFFARWQLDELQSF